MKNIQNSGIWGLLFGLIIFSAQAQETYEVADNSIMMIKGTSTLHDWESEVTEIKGKARLEVQNQCPQFEKVTLTIPVKSIKSGKSAMDKNTYEALHEREYPTIQFALQQIKPLASGKIQATGELRMVGTLRLVQVEAKYEVVSPSLIRLMGTHTMKMTDFGIEPPTAVFGTIKTGDEITINYTLYLNNIN